MSEDSAAFIARLDRAATHHRTACGEGSMPWRVWGTGPATIVLLHGGFGSWLHWIRNIEPLAERFRVIVPDLPGLGDADHPGDPVTPERLGEIVTTGLGEMLADGDQTHLVGFSFGGLISGQVAARLGERIASLTLVGASGLGLARPRVELVRRNDDMHDDERMAALRYNLRELMFHDASSIDDLSLVVHARNDARARLKSRRMSLGDSLARALPGGPPALAGIWGEHDATVGEHLDLRRDLLQTVRPGAAFRVIAGAGHWVQYEAAPAFNAALGDLLPDGPRQVGRP